MTGREPHIAVREITAQDGDFLVDMVLEIATGNGESVTRRGVLTTPRLARYATGWGRPGDLGLIAVDLDGPRGLQIPVGAAWIRHYASTEPGKGFVDARVPELSISIVPGRRRMGIGRALLAALIAKAREHGVRAISMALAPDNPARPLYEEAGFVEDPAAPSASEESITLVLELFSSSRSA